MSEGGKWAFAYSRHGSDVDEFCAQYFTSNKRVLVLAAGGFDPRASKIPELLHRSGKANFRLVLIREQRPGAARALFARADAAIANVTAKFPDHNVVECEILADDGAVIAGYRIRSILNKFDFAEFDDVVVDLSALSLGASFPMTKILYSLAEAGKISNLHLLIAANVELDSHVHASTSDRVQSPLGFGHSTYADPPAAKLWIPQLQLKLSPALERIYNEVSPDEVCPILPFPARDIRLSDDLIVEYGESLDEAWQVDSRSFIYATEFDPLDVYRTITRIVQERRDVFSVLGRSEVVLTPMGSKVVALGALLTALELDLSVSYVETESYELKKEFPKTYECESISIWLHGGPVWYPNNRRTA